MAQITSWMIVPVNAVWISVWESRQFCARKIGGRQPLGPHARQERGESFCPFVNQIYDENNKWAKDFLALFGRQHVSHQQLRTIVRIFRLVILVLGLTLFFSAFLFVVALSLAESDLLA
jgi:hypothetical protein